MIGKSENPSFEKAAGGNLLYSSLLAAFSKLGFTFFTKPQVK